MALPVNATRGQRLWYVGLRVVCGLGFVFLLGPIIVIVPISLSSGSFLSYPLPGFSTRWYEAILVPFPWMFALENSLIVATATTIIATFLGTLAAVGLSGAKFPGKALIFALVISPLAVPLVITCPARCRGSRLLGGERSTVRTQGSTCHAFAASHRQRRRTRSSNGNGASRQPIAMTTPLSGRARSRSASIVRIRKQGTGLRSLEARVRVSLASGRSSVLTRFSWAWT